MRSNLYLKNQDADQFSCIDLLEYEVVGPHWKKLLSTFTVALRGFKPFIMIVGGFGAGKTLLLRKIIVEYSYIYPKIVPVYIPLRDYNIFRGAESVYDIIVRSIERLKKRAKRVPSQNGSECLDNRVLKALEDVQEEFLKAKTRRTPRGVHEIFEELKKRIEEKHSLKLVVLLDELEELVTYSTSGGRLSAAETEFIYSMLQSLIPSAYGAARKSYTLVMTSVYSIPRFVGMLLSDPIMQPLSVRIANLAAELAATLAQGLKPPVRDIALRLKNLGLSPEERRLAIHEYFTIVKRAEEKGELLLEPGVQTRLELIEIRYSENDYMTLLKRVCNENIPDIKPILFSLLATDYKIPPRFYIFKAYEICKHHKLLDENAVNTLASYIRQFSGKTTKQMIRRVYVLEYLFDMLKEIDRPILKHSELLQLARKIGVDEINLIIMLSRRMKILRPIPLKKFESLIGETGYLLEHPVGTYLIIGNKPDPLDPRKYLEEEARKKLEEILIPRKKGKREKRNENKIA